MKILFFALVLLFSIHSYAQEKTEIDNLFVRVYDLQGQKINKGKVLAVTDKSLQIKGKKGPINLDVAGIGSIKTKRSAGNNILIGSAIGTVALSTLVGSQSEGFLFNTAEGFAAGAIVGLPLGAAAGGLTTIFKNSKSYAIDGDLLKWKVFQETITK
ncbi:MAG: hypothetical protein R6W85_13875 [Gillisia sp.]